MTEETPDHRPRVTVVNRRAVSSRWADADQLRDAARHAGKKDGTYVLGDSGWAPVDVPPVVAWPHYPLHGDPGEAAVPDDTATRTEPTPAYTTIDLPDGMLPLLHAIAEGAIHQDKNTGYWHYRGQQVELAGTATGRAFWQANAMELVRPAGEKYTLTHAGRAAITTGVVPLLLLPEHTHALENTGKGEHWALADMGAAGLLTHEGITPVGRQALANRTPLRTRR